MEYLQDAEPADVDKVVTVVLNLVINGIPSIQSVE